MKEEQKGDLEEEAFPIRTYAKGELAMLYCPECSITTAIRTLSVWLRRNPDLWQNLEEAGYNRFRHCYLPKEVELIVKYLGRPG